LAETACGRFSERAQGCFGHAGKGVALPASGMPVPAAALRPFQ